MWSQSVTGAQLARKVPRDRIGAWHHWAILPKIRSDAYHIRHAVLKVKNQWAAPGCGSQDTRFAYGDRERIIRNHVRANMPRHHALDRSLAHRDHSRQLFRRSAWPSEKPNFIRYDSVELALVLPNPNLDCVGESGPLRLAKQRVAANVHHHAVLNLYVMSRN